MTNTNASNAKPTITHELASSIHWFRIIDGKSDAEIMRTNLGTKASHCEYHTTLRTASTDLLMTALVNGYNVEQSPHDEMRKVFEHNRKMKESKSPTDIDAMYYRAKENGIISALDTLGITVDGINC